jgi:hypothetical protein
LVHTTVHDQLVAAPVFRHPSPAKITIYGWSTKPCDEGACFVGESGVFALVFGLASGERTQVVVTDLLECCFVEAVGAVLAGGPVDSPYP